MEQNWTYRHILQSVITET